MKMMMTIMALTMVVMMTMPTNCILTLPDCCGWALPVQVHFAKIARVKKGNQAVGPIRTDSLSSPSKCTHFILSSHLGNQPKYEVCKKNNRLPKMKKR